MMQQRDGMVQFVAVPEKSRQPGGRAVTFFRGMTRAHPADIQQRAADA
jgi:hypothetical protein